MKNAQMHKALCRMFPDATSPYPWTIEQGPHTNWEIAITEWNIPGQQPTQAQLDAEYLKMARIEKVAVIHAGHDAALAGVVAISDPTPTTVAVEAALLAATDLAGLEYARQKLATRRAELLAAVNAAATVEVLDAVVVSYPV